MNYPLMLCQENELALADNTPIHYFWLDRNVGSEINKYYLTVFRTIATVDPISDENILASKVKTVGSQERIRVIACASLDDRVY